MVSRLVFGALVLTLSTVASAQTTRTPQTPSSAAASARRVDGEADAAARALPLRLTLLDPSGLSTIPSSFSCQDTPEEEMRLQSLIQLNAASLPLTRRLTLHSFSRWGCPRTAGAAVGATYAITLAPRLALVLAAGVASFPQAQRGGLFRPTLRADLQWTTRDGKPRSVGIDAVRVIRSAIRAGAQRRVGASVSGSF
jgi:hypothetical protein